MDKDTYKIGEFLVDMTRNQIHIQDNIISVEPKILEVLLILAEHHGEVVSHQQITARVWPDSVVVPSALQRCIAQLRKAFGDDAKKQAVIETHAKKGYSLALPVTWHSQESIDSDTHAPVYWFHITATILIVFTLIFTAYFYQRALIDTEIADIDGPHQFSKLTPLTSTDKPEYYSTFSPDGQYIAFTRHTETDNHGQADIWVHELANQSEFQLTKENGHAGEPAWSSNGNKVAFILDKELKGRTSSGVYAIDFTKHAKGDFSSSTLLHACQNSRCRSVQWLSDDTVAIIEIYEDRRRIITKNLSNGALSTLFEHSNSSPYSLSYSSKRKQLAVMLFDRQFQHKLLLINTESGAQDYVPFAPGKGNNYWSRWNLKWNAASDGFITATASKLLHVSLQGQISQQPMATYKYVLSPEFHPEGESIALTLGYVDRDISKISWNSKLETSSEIYQRSIRRESFARYQPHGSGVSFVSDRGGSKQLWLSKNNTVKQLSKLSEDESIVHYTWAPNGSQLAVLVNQQVYIADLGGSWQPISFSGNVIKIFQWLPDNSLLLSTLDNEKHKLIKLNLEDNHTIEVYDGFVLWAQETKSKQVFLTTEDKHMKVFKRGETSYIAADTPSNLVSADFFGRFLIKNDAIYWLTPSNNFQKYSIASRTVETFFTLEQQEVALGDIDIGNNQILVTHAVSTNKEIVLLHN